MTRRRLRQLSPRIKPAEQRVRPISETTEGTRIKTQAGAHLYKTARWRRLVEQIRARDGYTCRQTGVMLIGKAPAPNSPVVDHIIPHRGDEALFWDPENLQTVSKRWHDTVKQRIERQGGI